MVDEHGRGGEGSYAAGAGAGDDTVLEILAYPSFCLFSFNERIEKVVSTSVRSNKGPRTRVGLALCSISIRYVKKKL